MSKAVFTHKLASIYDDNPEIRYHFPQTYLRQVKSTIGDLIIYYEPGRTGLDDRKRTGRRAYVAVARVRRIDPDLEIRIIITHILMIAPILLSIDQFHSMKIRTITKSRYNVKTVGRVRVHSAERSARYLMKNSKRFFAQDFLALCSPRKREWDLPEAAITPGVSEEQAIFERPVVERVLSRPVRDAAFTRAVREAYGSTCAVTGLRLTNGRGRPEVQAAHIRPVEQHGPDSVRNGIALCGTLHWMFDRGLIAVGPPPNYELLFTRKGLPDGMLRMINLERRLRVPDSLLLRPAPVFLDFHRSEIFDRSD